MLLSYSRYVCDSLARSKSSQPLCVCMCVCVAPQVYTVGLPVFIFIALSHRTHKLFGAGSEATRL